MGSAWSFAVWGQRGEEPSVWGQGKWQQVSLVHGNMGTCGAAGGRAEGAAHYCMHALHYRDNYRGISRYFRSTVCFMRYNDVLAELLWRGESTRLPLQRLVQPLQTSQPRLRADVLLYS